MKITVELPDNLLIAAKTLAAQRKTTLNAMVKSALRREVAPQKNLAPDSPCEVGPFGSLSLKKRAEARTGDPVMRLLIGKMMKTARSFPVSHEFPFSPPPQIARPLHRQTSRRDDRADDTGPRGQAWLTWSTFVLSWPYEGRVDK